MSFYRSNVLSSQSPPFRALVIQWVAHEWHVHLYALTDYLTGYWSHLLRQRRVLRSRSMTEVGVFSGQSVWPEGIGGRVWVFWKFLKYYRKYWQQLYTQSVHIQKIEICVHWGIPVYWHDNLLFKCTAAFLPYTTEQSRQLVHYHWAPFLSSSHHFPAWLCSAPPDPSLCSCPTMKTSVFCCWTWKPQWTKQWCRSRQRKAIYIKVADMWRSYKWWINPKKVLQV